MPPVLFAFVIFEQGLVIIPTPALTLFFLFVSQMAGMTGVLCHTQLVLPEMESWELAQVGLKPSSSQSAPLSSWCYRCEPLCPATLGLLMVWWIFVTLSEYSAPFEHLSYVYSVSHLVSPASPGPKVET
jgi:hypothetical protein